MSSLAGYTSGILFESDTVAPAVNVNGWLTGRQPGTGGAQASSITLSGNTFTNSGSSATLPSVAIAQESFGTTLNAVNATPNLFNGLSLTGSTATPDLFTIADQIADSVDASNLGNVTLKSGNVYVTPNSFWAPSSTTIADVSRAVAQASASSTVLVKTGAYATGAATTTVNNLTVNVEAGVTGFTGLVLGTGVTNGTLAGAGGVALTGSSDNNTLTGNDGDNTITGGLGDDTIDGGLGTNTAVFSGNYDDYVISLTPTITVTGKPGKPDTSVDTLTNIQSLQFADITVPLDSVPTTLTVSAAGITYGDDGIVEVTVARVEGTTPVPSGTVKLVVNG
ncbi:MAG: hypothetical protein ACK56G_15735, partial [Pirellulaceae bacterium]